jgi:hypothetical protein
LDDTAIQVRGENVWQQGKNLELHRLILA